MRIIQEIVWMPPVWLLIYSNGLNRCSLVYATQCRSIADFCIYIDQSHGRDFCWIGYCCRNFRSLHKFLARVVAASYYR